SLGGGVALEGAVAIQMIRSDIERHTDVHTERVDGFELKAGQFQHVPLIGFRCIDHRTGRRSYIAADLRGDAAGPEDVPGESRGRSFSVGAGDADDFAFEEPAR